MSKILNRISAGFGLAVMGLLVNAGFAHAAADADLVASFASSSQGISDAKQPVLDYMTDVYLVVLVIAVALAGLTWGVMKIRGSFGGRRRKR